MNLLKKIKIFFAKQKQRDLSERLARLERGYIVLLKRVLEIDGVQLMPPQPIKSQSVKSKLAKFSNTILQTPKDEFNKGFNEPKPTIH